MTDHHMLPFGLLRLLKPCKVKRFLATEDLSVGGLVTGSSGNQCEMEIWVEKERGDQEERRPVEEGDRKVNHGVGR